MSDYLTQKIDSLFASNKLPWFIIVVGIAFRLFRYLYNPSLWFDESNIAIDIISRPLSGLVNPSPDYNQAYPLAFLILIKFLIQVLGTSEYAIRLFPLSAGITALFLFYKVAKSYIEPKAVLIALGLFAVSDFLIFQSSNLKPYSSDVLLTLIIITGTIYVQSKILNIPRVMLYGIIGATAIWFSNPSVFVLAGVGTCLGVFSIINRDWKQLGRLSISYSMWCMSFFANYFLYIRKLQASFTMDMDWMLAVQNAYMPLPPTSIADIKWFIELFFDIFSNPLAMTLTGITALAFLTGCVLINTQKRKTFFILIAPIAATFLAAALHEYPFKGRFIFFLVPLLLLIIAEGAEYLRSRIYKTSRAIGIIFILLFFFHPVSLSAYRIMKPFYQEDIKPIIKYVKDNWQKGDILYVHYYAHYPFDFYSNFYTEPYSFRKEEYIIGIAPRKWYRNYRKQDALKYYDPAQPIDQSNIDIFKTFARDLDQLKGNKRVWLLFTTAIPKEGIIEEKFFIYHLATIGRQVDFFGQSGVSAVYLYDLSGYTTTSNN